ncbi:unannotated protein [freshwater metagenome]|uniref:Unannotated protein n=2 Tax=freshwater metagenome TaxID=449393 RepID=A0A6J6RAD8_9ZZZZ
MQLHVITNTTTLHRTEIGIAILNKTHGSTKKSGRGGDDDVLAHAAGSLPSESTPYVGDHDTNIGKFHLQRPRYLALSRDGDLCRNQYFESTARLRGSDDGVSLDRGAAQSRYRV